MREEADAVATRCGAGLRVTALGANLTAAAQRNAFLHAGQLVVATPGQIAQVLSHGWDACHAKAVNHMCTLLAYAIAWPGTKVLCC